jgi:hypothetical protein
VPGFNQAKQLVPQVVEALPEWGAVKPRKSFGSLASLKPNTTPSVASINAVFAVLNLGAALSAQLTGTTFRADLIDAVPDPKEHKVCGRCQRLC